MPVGRTPVPSPFPFINPHMPLSTVSRVETAVVVRSCTFAAVTNRNVVSFVRIALVCTDSR